MKKKYYYNCPIKALYMMREFGVNFSEAHGTNHADKFFQINESELCDFATGVIEDFRGIEQIYVAPESEHIFEPKERDLGIYNGDLWSFIAGEWCYWNNFEDRTKNYDFIKNIVERDNKHFFNPKEEN